MRVYRTIMAVVLTAGLTGSLSTQDTEATIEAANVGVVTAYSKGDRAEAITLAMDVLARAERALGPDHPDMLNSLRNMALPELSLYRSAGVVETLSRAVRAARGWSEHEMDAAPAYTRRRAVFAQGGTFDNLALALGVTSPSDETAMPAVESVLNPKGWLGQREAANSHLSPTFRPILHS